MAKKIILSFTANPNLAQAFNIFVNYLGLPIYYSSGQGEISLEYLTQGTPDNPPEQLERQGTLDATIKKTLAFLNTYYYNDYVYYQRVNDTIEMVVNLPNITVNVSNSQTNLTITVEEISDATNLNLKYFFQYTNVVGDSFLCQIFKKRYLGDATEVNGTAVLQKGSVENHTDPIRGTALAIDLEANLNLTFDDLYTENEQDYKIIFKKNDKILFIGFLKPDGLFHSYRNDNWIISLDCVDGLGILSNLSFVKDSGFRYDGKLKVQDIVYNCLKRTSIVMNINVAIDIIYEGLNVNNNTNILNEIYLNSERFFKEDSQGTGDGTLMSCEEVLKSILVIFKAVITQDGGEWYIYKADQIFNNNIQTFKRYDLSNVYVGNKQINLYKKIGSQIDNFYPHFAGSDHKLSIKGGINAFRLGYKYGFLNGLLPNGNLKRNGVDFEFWTPNFAGRPFIINDPLNPSGLVIKTQPLSDPNPLLIITSTPIPVEQGNLFDFKCSLSISGGSVLFAFRISVGSNYLNNDGVWSTNPNTYYNPLIGTTEFKNLFIEQNSSFKISTAPIPINGNLIVEIYRPVFFMFVPGSSYLPNAIIRSLDFTTNTLDLNGKVGEFHTVERGVRISSIIKENESVIIGDQIDNFFSGTIYKNNQLNTTDLWNRIGNAETYPILRIAAETELRLGQKPLKVFSGSIYGYIPYNSIIEINNIEGKFMVIDYNYDTARNIVTFKLLEVISSELPDINYKYTFDYGNTVKPTIIS